MPLPAIVGLLAPILGNVANKFLKNKGEKAKFLSELNLKLAEQETKLIDSLVRSDVAQSEVNKIEAQSSNLFKSGWRPALSWCCVVGFAWNIFLPVVKWGLALGGIETPAIPTIGGEMLVSMTFGILGLGAYRTYEKKAGLTK
jgi:hypothetical protein